MFRAEVQVLKFRHAPLCCVTCIPSVSEACTIVYIQNTMTTVTMYHVYPTNPAALERKSKA